jgi:glyoxylase-like metal-dependent hydrolase (beta-lactamase superfamily II)
MTAGPEVYFRRGEKGRFIMKRLIPGAFFLIFGLAISLQAQQNQPKLSIIPVAGPVYMLGAGSNGNVGIVADPAGVFMIDAMEEEMAGQIRAAIRSLPGGDRVRVLVNTHWHWDHVNGNKAFGPAAVIVAHENVRALNAADQAMFGGTIKALPAGALPVITYSDKLVEHAGGETIRLVHYPRPIPTGTPWFSSIR